MFEKAERIKPFRVTNLESTTMLSKPQAKASYAQTTMSFINVVFEKAERIKPFRVTNLEQMKQNQTHSSGLTATEEEEPYKQSKIYQVLLSKFPIASYGSERLEQMAKLMYEMEFFDATDMVNLSQRDFQRYIESHIAKAEEAKEGSTKDIKITPGIVNALWQATRPTGT